MYLDQIVFELLLKKKTTKLTPAVIHPAIIPTPITRVRSVSFPVAVAITITIPVAVTFSIAFEPENKTKGKLIFDEVTSAAANSVTAEVQTGMEKKLYIPGGGFLWGYDGVNFVSLLGLATNVVEQSCWSWLLNGFSKSVQHTTTSERCSLPVCASRSLPCF